MRSHDELVREEFFPEARRFEGEALERAHGERSVPAREREADRRAGGDGATDVEAGASEEINPAVPGIEMEMGAIEEAAIVLRKAAEQDVPAEVGVTAVRQGCEEGTAFGE